MRLLRRYRCEAAGRDFRAPANGCSGSYTSLPPGRQGRQDAPGPSGTDYCTVSAAGDRSVLRYSNGSRQLRAGSPGAQPGRQAAGHLARRNCPSMATSAPRNGLESAVFGGGRRRRPIHGDRQPLDHAAGAPFSLRCSFKCPLRRGSLAFPSSHRHVHRTGQTLHRSSQVGRAPQSSSRLPWDAAGQPAAVGGAEPAPPAAGQLQVEGVAQGRGHQPEQGRGRPVPAAKRRRDGQHRRRPNPGTAVHLAPHQRSGEGRHRPRRCGVAVGIRDFLLPGRLLAPRTAPAGNSRCAVLPCSAASATRPRRS